MAGAFTGAINGAMAGLFATPQGQAFLRTANARSGTQGKKAPGAAGGGSVAGGGGTLFGGMGPTLGTALTGPGGVDPTMLNLGKNTLLGD